MFLGLRTVIYPAPDLDAAKAWFTTLLGQQPYFDEPFYVGYEVGGYELGLNPDADVADGAVTYWGVPDCDEAMRTLMAAGATEHSAVNEVGAGHPRRRGPGRWRRGARDHREPPLRGRGARGDRRRARPIARADDPRPRQ